MKSVDIVIIGGGMVGLAVATLLKDTDCQIQIIEKQPPQITTYFSNRVSAINAKSESLLMQIGALQHIPLNRIANYQKMDICEKDSFARITFDNNDELIQQLGLSKLGMIIENNQIQSALWQQVSQQKNAEITLSTPKTMGISENGVFLTLENGEMISAKLVIGADGVNSWVRQQANIPLTQRDYEQTALVCTVKTTELHNYTARQIFSSDSILAFLPLAEENLCSIVWSLPPEQAQHYKNCDEQQFNKALNIAFDNQLGLLEVLGERDIYPLSARYARDFAQPRLVLVGDAAHTIHPLAGLGVNLGFADALLLAEELKKLIAQSKDIGEYRHLRYFERKRKAEAVKLLTAMEGLKQLFNGNHPLKKLLRGIGLSATDKLSPIKKYFIEQATML